MKRFRLSPLLIYYFSFKNKKKIYTKFLLTRDQRKKKKKNSSIEFEQIYQKSILFHKMRETDSQQKI